MEPFLRVLLSAEMEVLRGPVFVSLCLALFAFLWNRIRYAGLLPKGLKDWGTFLDRCCVAIALTYSLAGLIHHIPVVSLIGFAFALLTLILSFRPRGERRFLRSMGWVAFAVGILGGLFFPTTV
jgi:hypothetical protein